MIKLVVELDIGGSDPDIASTITAMQDVGLPEPYHHGYKPGRLWFHFNVSGLKGDFQFGIIHRALEELYPYMDTKYRMIHFKDADSNDPGWYVHSNGLYNRRTEWT